MNEFKDDFKDECVYKDRWYIDPDISVEDPGLGWQDLSPIKDIIPRIYI